MSTLFQMTMRYKSPLLRYGFTLLFWPLLMFDFIHESQTLDEMLFENLILEQVFCNLVCYFNEFNLIHNFLKLHDLHQLF